VSNSHQRLTSTGVPPTATLASRIEARVRQTGLELDYKSECGERTAYDLAVRDASYSRPVTIGLPVHGLDAHRPRQPL
jgi:hypothetical protein